MIIGDGQLAQAFLDYEISSVCIFASGVADSTCIDSNQFLREEKLLLTALHEYKNKKIVYFSSCALSASEYPRNLYYQHKANMENLIKKESSNYYIFRIPQLFGNLKKHKTLINFIYNSIYNNCKLQVYNQAYRYVITIGDVRKLVEAFLNITPVCTTVDLANPYRYSVLEIVSVIESLLNKKANIEIIDKYDGYILDLSCLLEFISLNNVDIIFSHDYLYNNLSKIIDAQL